MSAAKRAVIGAATPLDDAGILLHVLNILGPGQHLFISAVSKAWQESYERVESVQIAELTFKSYDEADLYTICPDTTLCSAAFATPASLGLAHECGLTFGDKRIQRVAGKVADIGTLRAAKELGLAFTDYVLMGAAESSSTLKLGWLHAEQACLLPPRVSNYAARSGSTDVLRWLKERGVAFTAETCEGAAAGAHRHVLQYLRDEGCEWDETTCSAAAASGHLELLKWLHEQGCPWQQQEICSDAASSG
eukprot:5746-Heterococcus_DN1.PRE.2